MLLISQGDLEGMRKHAEETYPHECCGVLLGLTENERNVVEAIIRCANTRENSLHDRYEIDPRELVKIQREARELGLEMVGFYHSHPDHAARWSPTDLAEAHWIGSSYVITSVRKGEAVETKSFRLTGTVEENKQFEEEEIELVNE